MVSVDPTKRYEIRGERVDDITRTDLLRNGNFLLRKFTREELVPILKRLMEEYAKANHPRGALSR